MTTIFRLFLLLLLAGGAATAEGVEVTRETVATPRELPGLFTLLLIGEGGGGSDAERAAILDREGDAYSFLPVTPDYRVTRLGGQTAPAALAAAEKFFAGHCAYNGYRLKGLRLSTGPLAGYELVPDYPVALCESGNVVSVGYVVGDNGEIKVFTNLLLPVGDGLPFDKAGMEKTP